jgi:hypothetical protein
MAKPSKQLQFFSVISKAKMNLLSNCISFHLIYKKQFGARQSGRLFINHTMANRRNESFSFQNQKINNFKTFQTKKLSASKTHLSKI